MIEIKKVQNLVKTSYNEDDVTILLKDLSNEMVELSTEEREKAIQSGVHYSEMLPQEKEPSKEYEELFEQSIERNALRVANDTVAIAETMLQNVKNNGKPVIISLARAGIPVGILIKRYLKYKYNIECSHYAISIIRDKGIDVNAMEFIYKKEVVYNNNIVDNFFFIDGWTGKGAIQSQLIEAVSELKRSNDKWEELSDNLYVLADPAYITPYCGTHDDYLLPSACLNSTVSGLTSRTILNSHVDIKAGDFHGAVYFEKFKDIDKSNMFIDTISNLFNEVNINSISEKSDDGENGMLIVEGICKSFDVADYKKVKPGIGETTRVLLRRVPDKVLLSYDADDNDPDLQHIFVLCKEKNVPIVRWDLGNYKVCGIIKELSADA